MGEGSGWHHAERPQSGQGALVAAKQLQEVDPKDPPLWADERGRQGKLETDAY